MSGANLRAYEAALRRRNVLTDLETFRKAPLYLKNPRLFDVYPRLLIELAQRVYEVDGSGKGRILDAVLGESKVEGLPTIVCIKQVPKAQELSVDPVTKTLKRVGVPSEINPPDQNALEAALRLREVHGGEVLVLSMGPTSFDESLERAIAMGADRAYLVSDRALGGSDTVPTADTPTAAG